MLVNTGEKIIRSNHKLLSTVAYQIEDQTAYAIEGSIFMAGAIMQWLRDSLGIIKNIEDSNVIAASVDNHGVYLIPAFTGLGAPYWKPKTQAALFGLTRDTNRGHIIRAALESVAFQTKDLLDAMSRDLGMPIKDIRVDGGMAQNNWLMQYVSNLLGITVSRPINIETTVMGAVLLVGLKHGLINNLSDIATIWKKEMVFLSSEHCEDVNSHYETWQYFLNKLVN